jgi:hypothetical protein
MQPLMRLRTNPKSTAQYPDVCRTNGSSHFRACARVQGALVELLFSETAIPPSAAFSGRLIYRLVATDRVLPSADPGGPLSETSTTRHQHILLLEDTPNYTLRLF